MEFTAALKQSDGRVLPVLAAVTKNKKEISKRTRRKTGEGTKGIKTYNCNWEKDPLLKTWIRRHAGDSGKVCCHFCQSVIRAHKNDLLEHSRTRKHQKNFSQNASAEEYSRFIELGELEFKKDSSKSNNVNVSASSTSSSATSSTCSVPTEVTGGSKLSSDQATITVITPRPSIYAFSNLWTIPTSATGINAIVTDISAPTTSTAQTLAPVDASQLTRASMEGPYATLSSDVSVANCITTSVPRFLKSSSTSTSTSTSTSLQDVLGNAEDFWQDSEDFPPASSPDASALVSVILEEQLSPTTSSSNQNSNCEPIKGANAHSVVNRREGSSATMNSMLLNGIGSQINLNILEQSDSVNINNNSVHNQQEVDANSFCMVGLNGSGDDSEHNDPLLLTTKHASIPFAVTDILNAIEEGHFSFADLCSLAKASVNQIDRFINGVNGNTFCTSVTPTHSSSTNMSSNSSLSVFSPQESEIALGNSMSMQTNNTLCCTKDKSTRKRRSSEHQFLIAKVEQL